MRQVYFFKSRFLAIAEFWAMLMRVLGYTTEYMVQHFQCTWYNVRAKKSKDETVEILEFVTFDIPCPRCKHRGLERAKRTLLKRVFWGDSYYCPHCLGQSPATDFAPISQLRVIR